MFEIRCVSLEQIELHKCASSEMITGGRPEVKHLVKLVAPWILEDPCIMIVHSLLSDSQEEGGGGEESYFGVFCIQGVQKLWRPKWMVS